MRWSLAAGLVMLAACDGRIESTADLYRAIHDRYADRWYRTVILDQDNVFYRPDGTEVRRSVWGHEFNLPGELRIDVHPVEQGNGTLIARDSIYSFQSG